jgi:hypothetical protein
MSQQTKITKVLEQLKNAEDKHVETVDALGENIGVYMADISTSLNEMTQVMMMSLTNTSALMEDIMVNGSVANDILIDQLLDSREGNGIADEENEREDQQFKEGLSDKVDDIHDELKKGNKDKKDEKKGFFKSLMSVGAMIFGKLLSVILKPLSFLKSGIGFIGKVFGKGGMLAKVFGKGGFIAKLFGKNTVLGKVFGKGGMLAKVFGKGGMLAKVFGKGGAIANIVGKFGKLTGLTALFGRLAPMLSVLGKVFVPLGIVITGFKVIGAAIEEFIAGGDPAAIISAGIGAFVEFFTFGFLKKDQVKDTIEGPIRSTIDFFVGVFHAVSDFVSGTIMPFVQNTVIPAIQSAFFAVYGFFKDHIIPFITETLIPFVVHVVHNVVMPIVMRLFETFKKVFEIVKTYIMVAWEIAKPIIMALIEFVTETVIPFIRDTVIPIIMKIVDTVWNIVDWILGTVLWLMKSLITSGFLDLIINTIVGIINGIIDVFNFVAGVFEGAYNLILKIGVAILQQLQKAMPILAPVIGLENAEALGNTIGSTATRMIVAQTDGESLQVGNIDYESNLASSELARSFKEESLNDAAAIDTREIEAQKQQAAAPSVVNNNNVTNVQGGGGGGGGGAIIAPSATRMNESSFRTQTQNGMVPAMEG